MTNEEAAAERYRAKAAAEAWQATEAQARTIEVSAAQIRSYEAALAWYADPDNWTVREHRAGDTITPWSWTGADLGERARIALARWRENKR